MIQAYLRHPRCLCSSELVENNSDCESGLPLMRIPKRIGGFTSGSFVDTSVSDAGGLLDLIAVTDKDEACPIKWVRVLFTAEQRESSFAQCHSFEWKLRLRRFGAASARSQTTVKT